ncbi:hypothetical protein J4208_02095 [Candidatus Woesearchaeota archaeon]|nr:hypothetical protein [Candidatus Woesearchaeota archaeon]
MRFRHLSEGSLDQTVTAVEKSDEKTVAKVQLLHSKEWKEHVAEHHDAGSQAQLVTVNTAEEESDLLKKTAEKKEEPKPEEKLVPQHSVDHGQDLGNSKGGSYLAKGSGSQKSGPGSYFGADSARGKAMVSGQCSCGMEVSTGWEPEQTLGQPNALQTAYNKGSETDADKREENSLYSTGMTSPNSLAQEQRPLYNSTQPTGATSGFGDQKRRRTSSL